MGGSLKIWQRSGFFFFMRFHFSIKASFIGDTKGWYCMATLIFFFLLAVLFQEGELPASVSFIYF